MQNIQHPMSSLGIKEVSLSGIRVERLEDRLDPKVAFPHKHDFYQIILILSGSGAHQIDFVKHRVSPRSMFLMKPNQVHTWTLAPKTKGLIIEFTRESFFREKELLIGRLRSSPDVLHFKQKPVELELKTLALELLREFQEKTSFSELALATSLTLFVVKILRLAETPADRALKSDLKGDLFQGLVEVYFSTEHRVEFYARKLGVSPKALTMQLTRLYGRSPRTIIRDRVLLEAKRLLAFSQLSVAEIGYRIGFDDPNYFTRFFRLHEKKTPAAFRKIS